MINTFPGSGQKAGKTESGSPLSLSLCGSDLVKRTVRILGGS